MLPCVCSCGFAATRLSFDVVVVASCVVRACPAAATSASDITTIQRVNCEGIAQLLLRCGRHRGRDVHGCTGSGESRVRATAFACPWRLPGLDELRNQSGPAACQWTG